MGRRIIPSIKIPIPVLYDPMLSHPARIVYGILVRQARGSSTCCLAISDIATKMGVRSRQVYMYLDVLKKAGLIFVDRQLGSPSIYTIVDLKDVYYDKDGELRAEVLRWLHNAKDKMD